MKAYISLIVLYFSFKIWIFVFFFCFFSSFFFSFWDLHTEFSNFDCDCCSRTFWNSCFSWSNVTYVEEDHSRSELSERVWDWRKEEKRKTNAVWLLNFIIWNEQQIWTEFKYLMKKFSQCLWMILIMFQNV